MQSLSIILAFIIGLAPGVATSYFLWRRNEQLTNLLLRKEGLPKLEQMAGERKKVEKEKEEKEFSNIVGTAKNPLAEMEKQMFEKDNEEYAQRNGNLTTMLMNQIVRVQ